MSDRGITFSGAMVRALDARRKWQTRRLATSPLRTLAPGDRLYVREDWSTHRALDGLAARDVPRGSIIWMRASNRWHDGAGFDNAFAADEVGRRRAAFHMPRTLSRLTLLVTAVRIEALQAISEADGSAEGVAWRATHSWTSTAEQDQPRFGSAGRAYAALWDSLHTAPGTTWADNPDVVVLTFVVKHGNIDA